MSLAVLSPYNLTAEEACSVKQDSVVSFVFFFFSPFAEAASDIDSRCCLREEIRQDYLKRRKIETGIISCIQI